MLGNITRAATTFAPNGITTGDHLCHHKPVRALTKISTLRAPTLTRETIQQQVVRGIHHKPPVCTVQTPTLKTTGEVEEMQHYKRRDQEARLTHNPRVPSLPVRAQVIRGTANPRISHNRRSTPSCFRPTEVQQNQPNVERKHDCESVIRACCASPTSYKLRDWKCEGECERECDMKARKRWKAR